MKKLKGKVNISTLPMMEFPLIGPDIPHIEHQSVHTILQLIKKKDKTPLVNYNQAIALTSIKLKNGEELLSLEYRYFIYEIVNMLNTLDYEVVYNFLNVDWEKILGSRNIRRKILFENPLLKSAKDKLDMDMEIFRGHIDVTKGAVDCPKCGSEETLSVEQQTRSADEPMSIFSNCLQCKWRWRAQ